MEQGYLLSLRTKLGLSQRQVAQEFNRDLKKQISHGTIYLFEQDKKHPLPLYVSWLEGRVAHMPLQTVPACPDCGGAHVGRCHGHEDGDVRVLAPNERVIIVEVPVEVIVTETVEVERLVEVAVPRTAAKAKPRVRNQNFKAIQVHDDLYDRLKPIKESAGLSWTELVERGLESWLEEQEREQKEATA